MAVENVLDKTNRINQLFDFYQKLLTEKQQTFLKHYYHDDFSLGEIAEQFSISRQAVNEHIKRAEHMMQEYEDKLHLQKKYEQRQNYLREMEHLLADLETTQKSQLKNLLDKIIGLE